MAKINTPHPTIHTHEGAPAKRINAEQQLRRSVLACMLWESQFYEDGVDIAERIKQGVKNVDPGTTAALAIEARTQYKLRHAPLLLVSALAYIHRTPQVRRVIPEVVRRADELAEFVAIHCHMNGVGPDQAKKVLGSQVKRGLADAFRTFDAYQLAKYNRSGAIKLRDVLFMVHAKPADKAQEQTWKQLVDGMLSAPDTWEVALSTGGDKKAEFERLLRDGKLGYLALLRNLRNMNEAGVDETLVREAILARKGAGTVLPFRYVAAAQHAPRFERELDQALVDSIDEIEPLSGKTVVLVDVSASMGAPLSRKSDLSRMHAAATLGSIIPGDLRTFTFSHHVVEVPPRKGMAGVEAIIGSQHHNGTDLGGAVRAINEQVAHDRLIVITDEQSHTRVPDPVADKAYMVNVASYRNGVGYGKWTHIDGFSEAVLRYITAIESDDAG